MLDYKKLIMYVYYALEIEASSKSLTRLEEICKTQHKATQNLTLEVSLTPIAYGCSLS